MSVAVAVAVAAQSRAARRPVGGLRIDLVRPGIEAYAWLRERIAESKAGDALAPVTVVVPNRPAGRALQRWLAAPPRATEATNASRAWSGIANVRTMRIGELGQRVLDVDGRMYPSLDTVLERSAVRAAARAVAGDAGVARGFAAVSGHAALHATLARLFRELRRQEPDLDRLQEGSERLEREARGESAGAPASGDADAAAAAEGADDIGRSALECFRRYRAFTAGYADQTELRTRAAAALDGCTAMPAVLRELGQLVLFLPPRIDPADAALLGACSRLGAISAVALAWHGDPQGLGDEPARQAARLLSEAMGVAEPDPPPVPASLRLGAPVEVVRAPDAAEEVRETIRRIVADLERPDGAVALHRVAVLYRDMQTYGPLVQEALELAELPWFSLHSRSLLESRPGRALLALLRLPERRFARESVLEWLDAVPALPVVEAETTGDLREAVEGTVPLTVSLWERISRGARVVRGAAQWQTRLEAYATEEEGHARRRAGDEAPPASPRAGAARRMARSIAQVADDLAPPTPGSTWTAFVAWAERLRARYAGGAPADLPVWSTREQPFAHAVREALAALSSSDTFEGEAGTTLGQFLDTLEGVLEERGVAHGQLGDGVTVGPIQAIGGLTFERVYVLGMVEGTFPPAPGRDPFFPIPTAGDVSAAGAVAGETGGRRRWTDQRTRQRVADRAAFLTALAAGDGGRITLSAPAAYGGRAAFPSRWLLEVATCLERDLAATGSAANGRRGAGPGLTSRGRPRCTTSPSRRCARVTAPGCASSRRRRTG